MARVASFRILVAIIASVLAGCSTASAPIKNAPRVAATPLKGQLNVSTNAADTVGDVTPVFVSVANGTDISRAIVPSQIFAIDSSGNRIAPLPPGEAARQAGGAGKMKAVISSAAVSGVAEGVVGAAIGAIAGAFLGGAGTGAALGGAIGGGSGMVSGAMEGQHGAETQANEQINALALQGGEVRRDFTVSGYVFFPKGRYDSIEMLVVNGETGDTEKLTSSWR